MNYKSYQFFFRFILGELDANPPIQLHLTPNTAEFLATNTM